MSAARVQQRTGYSEAVAQGVLIPCFGGDSDRPREMVGKRLPITTSSGVFGRGCCRLQRVVVHHIGCDVSRPAIGT